MEKTLIIFSGLPGTGKSTLSEFLFQKLQVPMFRIDDIVSIIPGHMREHAHPFWDDMIGILLGVVETQLELGLSVIVDSVFMGEDRSLAAEIARKHGARFRRIYTYVSDEQVWEERVRRRWEMAPPEIQDEVATWERIQEQRKAFYPWKAGSALFVDGTESIESNLEKVFAFALADEVELAPL